MNASRLKFVFLCFAIILLSSCNKGNKIVISGSYPDGKQEFIVIERLNVNQMLPVDSLKVSQKGIFKTDIKLENPELITLRNARGKIINLIVFPGDQIELDISCPEFSSCYKVSGSNESADILELEKIAAVTKHKLDSLSALIDSEEDPQVKEKLISDFAEIFEAQRMHNIKFILDHITSLSSVYALYQRIGPEEYIFNRTRDLQYMKIVADSVKKLYPGSSLVLSLDQDVQQRTAEYNSRLFINKLAEQGVESSGHIDLIIEDKNGNELSLSSLAGKVVLLNFWASTNEESIQSNRVLQNIYNRYHDKGFEIYSVSLDNERAAWLSSVRFEDYNWIDVCELSYPDSRAASVYNVQSLPTTYLIDRDGNLVAKNINGKVLSVWLDNLL